MNVRDILSKVATKPVGDLLKVMDWMLAKAEHHWMVEANRHQEASAQYAGTSMGAKAAEAYSLAFDQWFTIRTIRSRISDPVRLIGGAKTSALRAA